MSVGGYLLGIALLAATLGAAAYGAVRIRARVLPDWHGAEARLAELTVALAALVVVPELLGTVGLFRRWVVALVLIALGLGAGRIWGRAPERAATPPDDGAPLPLGVRLANGGAFAIVTVVVAQWSAHVVASYRSGIWDGDSLWYHLPFATRFVQDGYVTRALFPNFDAVVAYFPANAEIVNGVAILPFGRDIAVPLVNLGWLALALLAGWCIGKRFQAPAIGLAAACVPLSVQVMATTQAGTARNDVAAVALFLTAAALLLHAKWAPAAVAIAGLATGLSLGVKLSVVIPASLLVVAVIVVAPRAARRSLLLPWLVPVLTIGGFWYVRNLVLTGNPLPWISSLGPISLPSPITESTANTAVINRLTEAGGWNDIIRPGFADAFGSTWWILVILALAGMTVAVLHRGDRLVQALGVVAIVSAGAYLLTPNGAPVRGLQGAVTFALNLRYVVPALALGLTLLAAWSWLARPAARAGAVGVLGVLVILQLGADGLEDVWEWAISPSDERAGVAIAVAAAVVIGVGWLARRHRAVVLGVAVVSAVAVLVAGFWVQRSYLDDRYRTPRDGARASVAWPWAQDLPPTSIGVFGDLFQHPYAGPDLATRVHYVGVELDDGGFRRARTCREWRRALADDDAEYVVLSPSIFLSDTREIDDPLRWTRSVPGTEEVFTRGSTTVLRLTETPDPDECS